MELQEVWSRGPRPTLGGRVTTLVRCVALKSINVEKTICDIAKAPSRGEGRARPGLAARANML